MKNLLIIVIISISLSPTFSQNSPDKKWAASLSFGIQAHDKRLFDFPPKEALLAKQPEVFGTYQISMNIQRQLFSKNKIDLFSGVGISTEMATFLRPFDHDYFKRTGTLDLNYTNRYYQNMMQIPFRVQYRAFKKCSFFLEVLPQFKFLTIANTSRERRFSKDDFSFYSAEANVGMSYSISKKIDIGMAYRAFQVKKIDKALFNRIIM